MHEPIFPENVHLSSVANPSRSIVAPRLKRSRTRGRRSSDVVILVKKKGR